MSELHFLIYKDGRLRKTLTSNEYRIAAYHTIKHIYDRQIGKNADQTMPKTEEGMLELLVKRKIIKHEEGKHVLTEEGVMHLKELEGYQS